jgi:hypothetical protein
VASWYAAPPLLRADRGLISRSPRHRDRSATCTARAYGAQKAGGALAALAEHADTPQFTGCVIDALYRNPELATLNGHNGIAAELADRYGLTDEGGRRPPSHRGALGAPREPSTVVVR